MHASEDAHGERHYDVYLLRGPALRASIATPAERMPDCYKRDQLLASTAKHQSSVRANRSSVSDESNDVAPPPFAPVASKGPAPSTLE